jgi:DNA-directed RNA polymerase alpha subunit
MYVHEMWKPRTVVHADPDPDLLENQGLDTRTYNALIRAGYERVSEVKEMLKNDPDKIKGLRNLGKKSFEALCNKLKEA